MSPSGLVAGGTVHHIAFRLPDTATQELRRQDLAERGYAVTEILDRSTSHPSISVNRAGVLFKIDTPGFDIDEPLLELGRSLKLPLWMEPSPEAIEGSAARIQLPGGNNPALAGR